MAIALFKLRVLFAVSLSTSALVEVEREMAIGHDPVGICCDGNGWHRTEEYGPWPSAGWMEDEEARAIINKCAAEFIAEKGGN